MDYSLLLVVEKISNTKQKANSRNLLYSKNQKFAYHIGIIDYL